MFDSCRCIVVKGRYLAHASPTNISEILYKLIMVNGFKRHIVIAAPLAVTTPSSVQNLMKSSSRRFDGKSRSLDDRD